MAIASIPVTAEQPAANALSSSRIPNASVALNGSMLVPITALVCGLTKPTMITAKMLTRNTANGTRSRLADSVIPNMFTAVNSTSPIRATSSRWWANDGNTLPSEAAPAARLTATVST